MSNFLTIPKWPKGKGQHSFPYHAIKRLESLEDGKTAIHFYDHDSKKPIYTTLSVAEVNKRVDRQKAEEDREWRERMAANNFDDGWDEAGV